MGIGDHVSPPGYALYLRISVYPPRVVLPVPAWLTRVIHVARPGRSRYAVAGPDAAQQLAAAPVEDPPGGAGAALDREPGDRAAVLPVPGAVRPGDQQLAAVVHEQVALADLPGRDRGRRPRGGPSRSPRAASRPVVARAGSVGFPIAKGSVLGQGRDHGCFHTRPARF